MVGGHGRETEDGTHNTIRAKIDIFREKGQPILTCRSSRGMMLLLLLLDSSGRCSSCLLRMAKGCWGGVLPRAPRGPPRAPGPRLGWGMPTGIGGAPCAPGICWACICWRSRGRSGRCCWLEEDENLPLFCYLFLNGNGMVRHLPLSQRSARTW